MFFIMWSEERELKLVSKRDKIKAIGEGFNDPECLNNEVAKKLVSKVMNPEKNIPIINCMCMVVGLSRQGFEDKMKYCRRSEGK